MDRLNKTVKCIFMDGITIKNAAMVFYIHDWKDHSLFNIIISNRGRPFVNHFWEQLIYEVKNINKLFHNLPPKN